MASMEELPALMSFYGEDTRAGVIRLVQSAAKKLAACEKEVERVQQMLSFVRAVQDR